MANVKISALTSGTPATTSVIPVSDSAGTVTNKVTVQSIFDLDARWNVFKPGAPSIVSVTAGNAQVTLVYAADTIVALLAQTPITDYSIQYSTNSGSTWTTFSHSATTDTTITVTGLTNGTSYLLRVAAVNGVGTGGYATSSAVTPATVPGAPTSATASAGNAQAALSWTAPSTGGSAITDYVVEYSSDSGSTWSTFADGTSTTASATVTGLTNGTAYIFRVSASNAMGTGSVSSSTSAVTPSASTAPGAPTSLSATAGAAQLALAWTAPASNGGSAITGYSVQYTPAGGSLTTVSTGSASASYTLTGLTNGTAYTVAVAAVNAVGTSAYSSTTSGTPVAVPGAPTSVAGTAGNAQVALTWTAPSTTGGSAITGYVVEYTPAGGSATTVNTGSATAAYTKTGLTNGTAYTFRVAAINAVGTGSYSSASSAVTPAAPAGVITLAYSSGSWSGDGTAGTPFVSSSTYGTSGVPGTLPFSFTATADCELTISLSHSASYDDNHGSQTVQYAIGGTVIPNIQHVTTVATKTQVRMIPLASGEVCTVYLSGGQGYNNPSDTYTTISASAVTPRAAKFDLFSYSTTGANAYTPTPTSTPNGHSLTGVGTLASPLVFPTPLYNNQVNGIFIRALSSGTLSYSAALSNIPDDDSVSIYISQLRLSPPSEVGTYVSATGETNTGASMDEGASGTRTYAIVRNRMYRISAYGGSNVLTNMTLWAV